MFFFIITHLSSFVTLFFPQGRLIFVVDKFQIWLSVLLSLTIECRTQLRPKRFKAAVGTSIARPVRHGRTICRRQIQHGCHNTSVWIVCSCKRRLLRKRGRAMLVPTAFLLSYADNQYTDLRNRSCSGIHRCATRPGSGGAPVCAATRRLQELDFSPRVLMETTLL